MFKKQMGGILIEAEIRQEWPRRKARYVSAMVEETMEIGEQAGDDRISSAAGLLLDDHEKGSGAL